MSIISGANAVTGAGAVSYQIERSLRFNSADSTYLSRTPGSTGSLTTWTYSTWVKRAALGAWQRLIHASSSGLVQTHFSFGSNDTIWLEVYNDPTDYKINTTQVFRDVGAWYHLVAVYDSNNATSSDRMRLYVNGARITALSTATYPTSGYAGLINSTSTHNIGRRLDNTSEYFNGYMAEIHHVDGQALDPTSFGEYNTDTGVWQPKAYTGSYGTNGFYLDFADNSSTTALGYDAAGSNDWTPNNFSVTAGAGNDSLVDTPTPYGTDTGAGGQVRGNYCTMNGVDSTNITLSNGNLTGTQATSWQGNVGTFLMTSGKWYWEVTGDDLYNTGLGVIIPNSALYNQMRTANSGWVGAADGGFGIIYNGAGSTAWWYSNVYTSYSISNYLSSGSNGDILQVAFDADSGKIWIGKNNTWGNNGSGAGNPAAGTNPADTLTTTELSRGLLPFFSYESGQLTLNAGQRPFAYTAPSGFKALCTQNLPEPTVVDGGDYFNTVLYTGNGSTQSITGVGFQPDFTWIKDRSRGTFGHRLVDAVRGNTKELYSNDTSGEGTETSGITAFNSDGFSLGSTGGYNYNTDSFVAWNWKAGGTGVSNTAGTITSTVSANTTAGFSIVTYTGTGSAATVGHGLGAVPSMLIVKRRSDAATWAVYHSVLGAGKKLELNGTSGAITNAQFFTSTPTSTVFSLGTEYDVNGSAGTFVAYCFAPVAGYSAFGSYTGNADTTGSGGPFIYLGFRPKWWMHKRTDASGDGWWVYDSVRNTYNPLNLLLLPNSSSAEITQTGTGIPMDFVSNGVKIRNTSTDGSINGNGATYIYAAFAENPFKYALAR